VYLYSFLNLGARRGWVVNAKPRPLYHRERPGSHFIGAWVGHRAGLDGCGKSRLHRDSIAGPSSSWRVAIPTELFRPSLDVCMYRTLCRTVLYLCNRCTIYINHICLLQFHRHVKLKLVISNAAIWYNKILYIQLSN
jgi:hypothetical protein